LCGKRNSFQHLNTEQKEAAEGGMIPLRRRFLNVP